jgi:uncharacterized membrane protein
MSPTDPQEPQASPQDPAGDPQVIVGVSFDDIYRAQEFLTAATRLAAHGEMTLRDAVLVTKDEDGKTHVRETTDPKPSSAALTGGMWAGLFGLLLGGPVGWLAGTAIGAGAGAAAAHAIDIGLPDEWVSWFTDAVQPGTVTVILLVDGFDANALVAEAERFSGARLVYANLDPGTMARVEAALAGVEHQPLDDPTPPPT